MFVALSIFLITAKRTRKEQIVSDYLEAILDKHACIDSLGSTPKIIFVGGSNLVFGINSAEIENQLGMPVVNLGLHADLGLEFMLNEAATSAGNGDIVVLSAEYYLDEGNERMKDKMRSIYPESGKFMNYSLTDIARMRIADVNYRFRKNVLRLLFGKEEEVNFDPAIYSRNAFNRRGDLADHLPGTRTTPLQREHIHYSNSWEGEAKLMAFREHVDIAGARLCYLLPPLPVSEFSEQGPKVQAYYKLLQQLEIHCLNSPEDVFRSDSLFFDTVYHLNGEGRRIRTEEVIRSLNEFIIHHKG